MNTSAEDKDHRKEVGRLLRRRPGWRFQAMSTPGSPQVWGYGSGREPEIFLTVDTDSISIHRSDTDEDVALGSAEELVAWLKANVAGSLRDQKVGVIDKLKSGRFFKWE